MNPPLSIACLAVVALLHVAGGMAVANARSRAFLLRYVAACIAALLLLLVVLPVPAVLGLIAWGFLIRYLIRTYNRLVLLSQEADVSLHDVGIAQARRQSIVPRLESFTAGYSRHERETFINTVLARGGRGTLAAFEAHPVLRASETFNRLIHELVSAEDQIRDSRVRYNSAIRAFNTMASEFPTVIFARALAFLPRPFLAV